MNPKSSNHSKKKNKKGNIRNATQSSSAVAVIGIACYYPDAENYDEFWDNLFHGKNSITEIQSSRWDINKYYSDDQSAKNKSVSKWAGQVGRIDQFDASFFNISAREAQTMDPQQRLLLEEAWHCIEDAGVPLSELQMANTSVYVGVMATDYYQEMLEKEGEINGYSLLGNYECILANRLSYFLNLTGESQSIDAACASSLAALHHAKESLLQNVSGYAIAAGVNIICHPLKYISFSKANMLSPDGQCKTFDASANGYVPGEGIGVLLLEKLENAINNGHHIYGIIRGSSVHHNGKTKSITAPSVEAQRKLISEVISNSKVPVENITYVEAHGTGTSLSDPVEIEGLTKAFKSKKKQFCAIGSVKTNIGHLEAAAGIAGVIKVLLMFQHRSIPKTLNIRQVNPIIEFEKTPFYIAESLQPWTLDPGIPNRIAGVSSFGFGGTGAHLILEEYMNDHMLNNNASIEINSHEARYPFILSAKTEESLHALIGKWRSYGQSRQFKSQSLRDISYTLVQGRSDFSYRFGAVVKNKSDLLDLINANECIHATKEQHESSLCISHDSSILDLGYESFMTVCQQHPLMHLYARKFIQKIATIPEGERLIALIKTNADTKIRAYLYLCVLASALLKSGFKPKYITGTPGLGILCSFVVSGMIEFTAGLKWLEGHAVSSLPLKRPVTTFYDPIHKQYIEPHILPKDFLQKITESVEVPAESSVHLLGKVQQLYKNQITFKKYLLDWNMALAKHQLSVHSLLSEVDDLPAPVFNLFKLIIVISMTKLYKKWGLTENIISNNNETLTLLINFTLHDVLSYSDIVDLYLIKEQWKVLEPIFYVRLNDLSPQTWQHIFKNRNRSDLQIPHLDNWLAEVCNKNASVEELSLSHNYSSVVISQNKSKSIDYNLNLVLNDLDLSLHTLLIMLWRDGKVDLKKWFPEQGFNRVALPVYSFRHKKYWLPPTQKKEIESINNT